MESFSSVFCRYRKAIEPLVLVGFMLAQVDAFRQEGRHLLLQEQQQGSGFQESEEVSMVQSGLRAVHEHSSTVGDDCFWPGNTTTEYNVLRLQMELDDGSVFDSVKECQKRCRETSNCTMITYTKKSKMCNLKMNYSPKLVGSSDEITVRKDCPLPEGSDAFAEPGGCYRKGIGSTTANITHKGASSVEACQQDCKGIANCTHFTFNVKEKMCHLKSGKPTWRAYRDDVTATRDCNLGGEVTIQPSQSQTTASPPETDCFKKDIGSTTGSMKEANVISLEACQELCRSTDGCTHVTFGQKSKRCYVKGGQPNWRNVWFDLSTTRNCDLSKETQQAVCFKSDIGSTTPEVRVVKVDLGAAMKSVKGCQAECQKINNCTHFTYNENSKNCYLKSGKPQWREYKGDMSGSRDCDILDPSCFMDDLASRTANIKEEIIDGGSLIPSLLACQDLCRSTSNCTHVTYNSRSKKCYVKGGSTSWFVTSGDISMRRDCK
ncbi:pan domain-containing protein [Cystoisospora suis]|uniref:Pan domain-containing protein n=1 Tax=Cystoisospora suis TaxID=483139 RepID=A0A2C6KJZ8_9APIC|nr:pan domain-containing protein [Cystoisospora suis]